MNECVVTAHDWVFQIIVVGSISIVFMFIVGITALVGRRQK